MRFRKEKIEAVARIRTETSHGFENSPDFAKHIFYINKMLNDVLTANIIENL